MGILKGLADDSILDKYTEIRSKKYKEMVNPISSANFRRLWEKDPEVTAVEDEFFKVVQRTQDDIGLRNKILEVSHSDLLKESYSKFSAQQGLFHSQANPTIGTDGFARGFNSVLSSR